MQKIIFTVLAAVLSFFQVAQAQFLTLPEGGGNQKCMIGQRVGITDIEIHWNAPGVKGREGKIWGTPVAHFGFQNLGFGTAKESPWRAGANENTTIDFSTDVKIEGKNLPAGKYGFHIAVFADSCTLIFSKNSSAWGSFFYKSEEDALRVTVRQQKDLPGREWLAFTFSDPTKNSVAVALEWEKWRIPFKVEVDLSETVLPSIRRELTGAMGFDGPSLQSGANWCLNNGVNFEEALAWSTTACDPRQGGVESFTNLSTKAGLERKLGKEAEAEKTMAVAMEKGNVFELHGYGRQLIGQKKHNEALAVFEKNFQKHGDAWPTHVGLARGYSAVGDLKKALEHAKIAQTQATDDVNKTSLKNMIKVLEEGKPVVQ